MTIMEACKVLGFTFGRTMAVVKHSRNLGIAGITPIPSRETMDAYDRAIETIDAHYASMIEHTPAPAKLPDPPAEIIVPSVQALTVLSAGNPPINLNRRKAGLSPIAPAPARSSLRDRIRDVRGSRIARPETAFTTRPDLYTRDESPSGYYRPGYYALASGDGNGWGARSY